MTEKPERQDWPEEPWEFNELWGMVTWGKPMLGFGEKLPVDPLPEEQHPTFRRVVACVNSMASIPDPEAWRAAVGRVVAAARRTRDAYRDGVTVDIMRAIRGPLVLALSELDRLEQGDGQDDRYAEDEALGDEYPDGEMHRRR